MIERILCAVDFSDTSDAAFEYSMELADKLAGEMVLLHAFDKPATGDVRAAKRPADQTLRIKLETMQIPSRQVHLKHVLHAGPPGEVICWVAQDQQCDLIVMGTHGRTGLSHMLFGSTAEYVLRHARCPVLTIRKRPDEEAPLKEPTVMPLPPPKYM